MVEGKIVVETGAEAGSRKVQWRRFGRRCIEGAERKSWKVTGSGGWDEGGAAEGEKGLCRQVKRAGIVCV